jgi:hypothetical protein
MGHARRVGVSKQRRKKKNTQNREDRPENRDIKPK